VLVSVFFDPDRVVVVVHDGQHRPRVRHRPRTAWVRPGCWVKLQAPGCLPWRGAPRRPQGVRGFWW
jgi:hypothetical protein